MLLMWVIIATNFRALTHAVVAWLYKKRATGDKPSLSSERMLHKDYDLIVSVAKKISGREPQGARRQDDVIGCKPSVVK
jgi:hypothetical protein